MRSTTGLSWRNLRAYPLRSILTTMAITFGVAMVLAATIVGYAARNRASLLSENLSVDLEVFSHDGEPFSDAVLNILNSVPEIEVVSPSLRVAASAIRPSIAHLTVLGVKPDSYLALHEPDLVQGIFLDRPDGIVLPSVLTTHGDDELHIGDEVSLAFGKRLVTLTITGKLAVAESAKALTDAMVAYVPLQVAHDLVGKPGEIDRLELALYPDADSEQTMIDLAGRLSDDLVVVRAASGDRFSGTAFIVQAGLAMVGGIILAAASFVILNAFAMSITIRTQEISALRAVGMTRRQVMFGVMTEAGMLGTASVVLGIPLGLLLALGVMHAMGSLRDFPFVIPLWGLALSVLLGMGVTLIGALHPAWRASRYTPLLAVQSLHNGRDGGWLHKGGIVGGILTLFVVPVVAILALILRPDFYLSFVFLGVGQVVLLVGTVLLMPAFVNLAVRISLTLLPHWLGTPGRLAADNLGRNKLRVILTVGTLTVALAAIIGTTGLISATLKSGLRGFFSYYNEDGIVTPDIKGLLATGDLSLENTIEKLTRELDPTLVAGLEKLAQSGAIELERIGFAFIPPELSSVSGNPGVFVDGEVFLRIGNFDFIEGDVETAHALMQRGRAILIQPIVAERLCVGVGDEVTIQTTKGEVEFTVAGIGGNGYSMSVFPYADGVVYFGMRGTSWMGFIASDGVDIEEAITQVRGTVAPFEGVAAGKFDEKLADILRVVDQTQLLLEALLILAVVVAAAGVVNTVMINVAERQREIGLLRAVGATKKQVRRAVAIEAAMMGLLASLIATLLSIGMLALYVVALTPGGTPSMGFRVGWDLVKLALPPALVDLGIAAAIALVLGPVVAVLAASIPAKRAADMEVVEATRCERLGLQ